MLVPKSTPVQISPKMTETPKLSSLEKHEECSHEARRFLLLGPTASMLHLFGAKKRRYVVVSCGSKVRTANGTQMNSNLRSLLFVDPCPCVLAQVS